MFGLSSVRYFRSMTTYFWCCVPNYGWCTFQKSLTKTLQRHITPSFTRTNIWHGQNPLPSSPSNKNLYILQQNHQASSCEVRYPCWVAWKRAAVTPIVAAFFVVEVWIAVAFSQAGSVPRVIRTAGIIWFEGMERVVWVGVSGVGICFTLCEALMFHSTLPWKPTHSYNSVSLTLLQRGPSESFQARLRFSNQSCGSSRGRDPCEITCLKHIFLFYSDTRPLDRAAHNVSDMDRCNRVLAKCVRYTSGNTRI